MLTVTFHRNTEEAPEVTLKYYTYDDTYDSLEINGTERFLVKAEDVDALVKQIKKSVLIRINCGTVIWLRVSGEADDFI